MNDIDLALNRARENAPYLAESLKLFPDLEAQLRSNSPDEICNNLFVQLPKEIGPFIEEMARLRQLKRQIHLISAIADISEFWSWNKVTETLTELADICMSRLLYATVSEQGIVPASLDNPLPGLFILAVGKYGAHELNYSSDIDFNIFYDPQVVELPNPARAERILLRLARNLIRGFEAITEDGYIFRTDLRLRPDPRSNAVIVSTRTAERYYETLGQNWERAAMIKARVCGGDQHIGDQFIDNVLSPFIWRKNLDYAAIEDILAMKRQIHALKGGEDIRVSGQDVKIGWGGIREIEFFAQVQQLILGGRNPELRQRQTLTAIKQLNHGGFVSDQDFQILSGHYAVLRRYEHAAQMMADAQTHKIPEDANEKIRFMRLLGYNDEEHFDQEALLVFSEVHQVFSDLFPEVGGLSSSHGNLVFTGVEPGPQTLKTLDKLGYQDGENVWHKMAAWLGGRVPATRSERAREILTNLAPIIIESCSETGLPDKAFYYFGNFFTRLRSGVNLLSMFAREPGRLDFLINTLVASPFIGETLAQKPQILDALADPDFLNISTDNFALSYAEILDDADGFEEAMNLARRMVREDRFRFGASILSGQTPLSKAGALLTQMAEATLTAMLPVAIKEVEARSGTIEADIGIIGLGKLGGGELSLVSDLDIMLVYQAADDDPDLQRKITKVTQRLISALSSYTEEGTLYEVDMALRPSGRSGPVAVSRDAYSTYYAQKAWTWEFMALSRGRVICATRPEFAADLETALLEAFMQPRPDLNISADIADMLLRIRREKPPKKDWDIKNQIGGLRDIEFIAQSQILKQRKDHSAHTAISTKAMLTQVFEQSSIPKKDAENLISALTFYEEFRQALALTLGNSRELSDPAEMSFALDLMHLTPQEFERAYRAHLKRVEKLVDKYVLNVS